MSYYLKRSSLSGVTYGRGGLIPGQWGSMGSLGEDEGVSEGEDVSNAESNISTDIDPSQLESGLAEDLQDWWRSVSRKPCESEVATGERYLGGNCYLKECKPGFKKVGNGPLGVLCAKKKTGSPCFVGGGKGTYDEDEFCQLTECPSGMFPSQGAPGTPMVCVFEKSTPKGGGGGGGGGGGAPGGSASRPPPSAPPPAPPKKPSLLANPLVWVGAAVVVGGVGLVAYKGMKR